MAAAVGAYEVGAYEVEIKRGPPQKRMKELESTCSVSKEETA